MAGFAFSNEYKDKDHLTTLDLTASIVGCLAAVLAARAAWRLRDTTFAAPCAWACLSLLMLSAEAAWSGCETGDGDTLAALHLQYLAAMTVVAPFVALLGAKRPQHVAWQWIVASLVGMLVFQDLRSWSIEGARPSPHAAWQFLLAAIVVMQLVNYLPTRYAVAATLASAAQFCLLSASLSFLPDAPPWLFAVGVILLSLAVYCAALLGRRRPTSADVWHVAWLDFRDLFGVLWALRVCQRVNAMAADQSSPQLSWHGISPLTATSAENRACEQALVTDDEPLRRALRSVLARFVSSDWLGSRNIPN